MPRKSHKNEKYSKELKQNAVQDYLAGKGSLRQISKKYGLLDNRQLRNWTGIYGKSFGRVIARAQRDRGNPCLSCFGLFRYTV